MSLRSAVAGLLPWSGGLEARHATYEAPEDRPEDRPAEHEAPERISVLVERNRKHQPGNGSGDEPDGHPQPDPTSDPSHRRRG
jgi:hypothetical protein